MSLIGIAAQYRRNAEDMMREVQKLQERIEKYEAVIAQSLETARAIEEHYKKGGQPICRK